MLTKDNVQDIYALTPMQEGMLVHTARDPSSTAYIEQFDFCLEGEINADAMQKCLDALLRKYDALRTIFSFRKTDQPRQIVLKSRNAEIRHESVAHLDDSAAKEAVELFKRRDREAGFNLSADLLMRVALLSTSPTHHHMVLTFHHIILDGWCLGILFKDFFTWYERLCAEPHLEIDEREPFPYREYIRWIGAQESKAAEAYWAEYLQGYQAEAGPPYFDLKHDGESEHATHLFHLGPGLSSRLAQIAKERRITINSIFQAAWGVLLQKFNNTDDVVFGTVVSGRPPQLPGVEDMVGLFINTLPLRVACDPQQRFIDVAERVHQRAFQSLAYDYHPLFAIQSASALKNRLLNHIVAFENYPIADRMRELSAHGRGLRVSDVHVFEQTSYDFNVIVSPGADIRVNFTYNRSRYSDDVVAGLARSLVHLLAQAAENPESPVAGLGVCAPDDAQRVLKDFNDTRRPYPADSSVTALFLRTVEASPDAIAMRHDGRCYTYRQLHAEAQAVARTLRGLGVEAGGAVGLLAPRSPELVIGMLGVLYCGAAYVPIDPAASVDRIRFMIEDADASVLCVAEGDRGMVPEQVRTCFLKAESNGEAAQLKPEAGTPDAPAYVMYTSGSTGLPKGCAVTHRNIVRLVRNTDYLDFGPHHRILQAGSPAFDASTWEIWGALLNGAQLCFVDEHAILDAVRLKKALREQAVTVLLLTPALFNQLCESDPALFAPLQYLMVGGDILSPRHIERVRAANPDLRVVNGYGPTENATLSTTFEIKRAYAEAIPIGRPIANSTAYVVDNGGNLLPPGAYGELCVGGDGVALGYVKRPALSAEKFIADPFLQGGRMYRTGDIARWLPDGTIGLLGRNDFQVKIRGFRVELGEIERTLCDVQGVREAVVVAHEGPGGKQLHAFYIADSEVAAAELRAGLGKRLPSYMVPSFYLRMERMPLTVSGKVDRRALPVEKSAAQRDAVQIVEPRSATEQRIAQICCDVLGIERIGMDDNLFEIGANSLNLITINNRLKDAFARDIALTALFEYTSVARLAEFIAGDGKAEEAKLAAESQELAQAKTVLMNARNLMRLKEESEES